MNRTPEQEAARRERRRREAAFTKCPCGNVAGFEQTFCGACRLARERAEDERDRFESIRRDVRCGLYERALMAFIDFIEESK